MKDFPCGSQVMMCELLSSDKISISFPGKDWSRLLQKDFLELTAVIIIVILEERRVLGLW